MYLCYIIDRTRRNIHAPLSDFSNLSKVSPLVTPRMSAAVMSNYYYPSFGQAHVADSQLRMQNWMLAQMAQYPPPPQPDHQHYNALYPASAGAQQLVEHQEQQLQYSNPNQPLYPKIESVTPGQASSNHHMHDLVQGLQQHALEEEQRQQIHQATHQIQPHNPHGPGSNTSHSSQPTTQQGADPNQKPRLRKACDSCSLRKVKV